MSDSALCWRIEAACRHAWPALEEIELGDWRLRFADGQSRRANSVNPMRPIGGDIASLIAFAEREYRSRQLRPIFRLPFFDMPDMIDPAIERQLAALGYVVETECLTPYAPLHPMPMRRDPDVAILPRPDAAWLRALVELQGWEAAALGRYRAIVERLAVPAGFMTLTLEGAPAAMAFGAIHDGIVCIESVVTAPAQRGRGHGRRLIGALLAWAIETGAEGACLQVDSANQPALALYRAMGFARSLYPYRYWVRTAQ